MKMDKIIRLCLAAFVVFVLNAVLLQAEVMTFDPPLEPGGVTPLDDWLEQGMLFTGPKGFSQYDSGREKTPDNGTAYLHFASGPKQTLSFAFVDSRPFTLVSVDLAEYSTFFPKPKTIKFVCHKTDETVLSQSFTVDGAIDGAGGISDFETFTFGPEFTEISYVEVPTTTYSMDNLVVLPLPGYETAVGLEITGPNNVEETTSREYDAIALFESGQTLDVSSAATWRVDPNTHASIDNNGLLETEDINAPEDITVYARYVKEDVTLNAEMSVRISPHTPRTLTVPGDYSTIQAAINESIIGDEIIVGPGTYAEQINFGGKRITLRSDDPKDADVVAGTIIDGGPGGPVVTFSGEEAADCVLSGFTITGGGRGSTAGGGIRGYGTRATIEYNFITGNEANPNWFPSSAFGGGLFDCDGIIRYNVISENGVYCDEGVSQGGGLYGCDGVIHHNLVSNNEAAGFGIGMGGGFHSCNGYITNNTVLGNVADVGGAFSECAGTVENCIVWGNSSEQIHEPSVVRNSDVQGGWAGEGNIDADPCFADSDGGDYHLKSQGGRWDANEGRWAIDDVTSPCIDSGDPMSPVGPEMFPNGGIVNMGAYGGTVEASKSYFGKAACEIVVAGDVNGDCLVDYRDFHLMALHWLE